MTRRLAQTVAGRSVVSSAAVQAYRGNLDDAGAVGRELNVRYVAQGEIRRDGEQVVVTAQLVDTQTRAQAWTARIAAPVDRPNELTELPVLRVLSQLRPALYEAESKRLPKSPASDASALELAFRGIYLQSTLDFKEQIKVSTEECDAVLRLDPALALALWCKARVAEWLLFGADVGTAGVLDAKRLAEMDELSARAIAMDRSDADIWNSRADTLRYQRRWDAVAEARARAIELNPALMEAYIESSRDLTRTGQPGEALTVLAKAAEIDPDVAKQDDYLISACRARLGLGQYDKAIESCEGLASGGFGRVGWQVFLAVAYSQTDQAAKAADARDKAIAAQRGLTISNWKATAVRPGDKAAYVDQVERYILPGMRKAGFPEK